MRRWPAEGVGCQHGVCVDVSSSAGFSMYVCASIGVRPWTRCLKYAVCDVVIDVVKFASLSLFLFPSIVFCFISHCIGRILCLSRSLSLSPFLSVTSMNI